MSGDQFPEHISIGVFAVGDAMICDVLDPSQLLVIARSGVEHVEPIDKGSIDDDVVNGRQRISGAIEVPVFHEALNTIFSASRLAGHFPFGGDD